MKFVTNFVLMTVLFFPGLAYSDYRSDTLRKVAKDHADYSLTNINKPFDPTKSKLGKQFFEDTSLSYNSKIACRTCHLNEFSSGDGLAIAVGVGTTGVGTKRNTEDGELLTRNTLPLWGRGGKGFSSFFWDGRVRSVDGSIVSPFGKLMENNDGLFVAVHLPFSEIDEMINEDDVVENNLKTEQIESAQLLFQEIANKVKLQPQYLEQIKSVYGIKTEGITFGLIANSIAHFIRDEFAIGKSKFFNFLNNKAEFSTKEIDGGLLFYGKGKCSSCHSGPLFSDFEHHVIPTVQLGYGKNGFGIDYGRFNVTHSDDDLYAFRTPPLYNVSHTAPYMHSGSIKTIENAISAHFDPLGIVDTAKMEDLDRVEFYRKIKASGTVLAFTPFLSNDEISSLKEFLETLSFSNPDL